MANAVNHLVFSKRDQITSEERSAVYQKLLAYNLEYLDDQSPRDLGIFLEDEQKNVIGALVGVTHGNWVEGDYLWVDASFRGRRYGAQLLKHAEDAAIERGANRCF